MNNQTRAGHFQEKEDREERSFQLYQMKATPDLRDYLFTSIEQIHADGNRIQRSQYECVYTGRLPPGASLEDLYVRFNLEHPEDFRGRSMSVSDVVVLRQGREETAWYCDRIGFTPVPEFLEEHCKQPSFAESEARSDAQKQRLSREEEQQTEERKISEQTAESRAKQGPER